MVVDVWRQNESPAGRQTPSSYRILEASFFLSFLQSAIPTRGKFFHFRLCSSYARNDIKIDPVIKTEWSFHLRCCCCNCSSCDLLPWIEQNAQECACVRRHALFGWNTILAQKWHKTQTTVPSARESEKGTKTLDSSKQVIKWIDEKS